MQQTLRCYSDYNYSTPDVQYVIWITISTSRLVALKIRQISSNTYVQFSLRDVYKSLHFVAATHLISNSVFDHSLGFQLTPLKDLTEPTFQTWNKNSGKPWFLKKTAIHSTFQKHQRWCNWTLKNSDFTTQNLKQQQQVERSGSRDRSCRDSCVFNIKGSMKRSFCLKSCSAYFTKLQ